jgi:hypothetical protein
MKISSQIREEGGIYKVSIDKVLAFYCTVLGGLRL